MKELWPRWIEYVTEIVRREYFGWDLEMLVRHLFPDLGEQWSKKGRSHSGVCRACDAFWQDLALSMEITEEAERMIGRAGFYGPTSGQVHLTFSDRHNMGM